MPKVSYYKIMRESLRRFTFTHKKTNMFQTLHTPAQKCESKRDAIKLVLLFPPRSGYQNYITLASLTIIDRCLKLTVTSLSLMCIFKYFFAFRPLIAAEFFMKQTFYYNSIDRVKLSSCFIYRKLYTEIFSIVNDESC